MTTLRLSLFLRGGGRVGNLWKADERLLKDKMMGYVAKKEHEKWLWHAVDLKTGTRLADVLGQRQDIMFLKIKKILKPFRIPKSTEQLKTYDRHLTKQQRSVSKSKMPKIERKHLTLRTRIKRL